MPHPRVQELLEQLAQHRAGPALGDLTLYQWIGSLAGHEARHAAQIREIGAATF